MTVLVASLTRAGARLLVPTVIAGAIAAWLARDVQDLASVVAASSATRWLHVPTLLLAAVAIVVAIEEWPMFCSDRNDARWIAPHLRRPWRGCVAASAGVLIALAVGLSITAITFAIVRSSEPARAHRSVATTAPERPVLAASDDAIRFATARDEPIAGVRLRALPMRRIGDPIAPIGLEIFGDGVVLHDRPIEITSYTDVATLQLTPPRRLGSIEIRRRPDAPRVPLAFPPRAVEVVAALEHSAVVNTVLAALGYLLPVALALALATALHRRVGTPVAMLATLGTLIATTVLELTPTVAAIAAASEGRWLPAESLAAPVVTTGLGCATLLAIGAALGGWRHR